MRRRIAQLLFGVAAVSAAATPHVETRKPLSLPAGIEFADDIRWSADDKIAVAAGRQGVMELDLSDPRATPAPLIAGEHVRGGLFFSSRLALTDQYVVAASPFGLIGWKRRTAATSGIDGSLPIAMTIDVDAAGDDIAILGGDRDGKGHWSPDGAIAWRGTLSNKLLDLQPILYSHITPAQNQPKAVDVANCGLFDNGAVRFLSDHSFIVVPGVEPGAYLFNRFGRLIHAWPTANLGFLDRCDIPIDQVRRFQQDVAAREDFLRGRAILDDVVAIGNDPALLIRWFEGGRLHWKFVKLHRDGSRETIPIDFTSASPVAHLRADTRGDKVVFLIKHNVDVRDRQKPRPYVVIGRFAP